jgi:general secretion pathway protein B
MSYILEALRRADTERENAIPNLSTALSSATLKDEASRARSPWLWIAAGLGLGLMLTGVSHFLTTDPPEKSAPAATVAVAPSIDAIMAPSPQAMQTPIQLQQQRALTSIPSTKVPSITPIVASSSPVPPPVAPEPLPRARPKAPPAPAPTATVAAAKVPAQAQAQAQANLLSELPDDIRRSLPSLQVGGSVYSDQPANRLLILNGQPFHEHDSPLPDLQIESIQLKKAFLNFKGYRYQIDY